MKIKKIKATTDKEKALERKALMFEERLQEAESTLLESNSKWKETVERQSVELSEMKEHLDKTKKQLDDVLKYQDKAAASLTPSKGISPTDKTVPKEVYLQTLAELAKSRDDRLKLSQYMSKLEVEYVQTKVELVNSVDRCNTLEQQVRSLKQLIKKLDTANTLKDWLEE